MKKIGLIGGVTSESTIDYYRLINKKVNEKLGGYNAAEIIVNSVNFGTAYEFLKEGDWDGVEKLFTEKAIELKNANVGFIAISSNTIAKVARVVAKKADLPLINIIESTAQEIKKCGMKKIGFFGTGFTMKSSFYIDELKEYGIDSILPKASEIETIHEIIMTELSKGIINEISKRKMIQIMERMVKDDGIEGVILGCTEFQILIKQDDTKIKLFDTTEIHTNYIVDYAFAEDVI